MATPDLDVIKDIPGYKVILKAVLKSQIQQLVEQLANNTDEESVILTASVADGTLSHLGSDSGKSFLEEHEDIKSQFLGFCLKRHHRKKQQEKERLEAEALQQSLQQASPSHYGGPMGGPFAGRSPRFSSPRGPGPIHPVALTRASPGGAGRSPGARHEPYPMVRPKRTSLNFDPGRGPGPGPQRTPSAVKGSEQIIKIEPDDNETSNQSESGSVSQDNVPSTSQSPSHQAKSESGDKDDDARSESSTSTIPNEPPTEGLSLDSDLSNLISEQSQQQQEGRQGSEGGEMDPNVSVKLEALTESEMELEITGVEPGRPAMLQDNWDPNVSLGMNFDPTGATGSSGDGSTGYSWMLKAEQRTPYPSGSNSGQGALVAGSLQYSTDTAFSYVPAATDLDKTHTQRYSKTEQRELTKKDLDLASGKYCQKIYREGMSLLMCAFPVDGSICGKMFANMCKYRRHFASHSDFKPFKCRFCDFRNSRLDHMREHEKRKHMLDMLNSSFESS